MSAVVADTHTLIWYLGGQTNLSVNALNALRQAVSAGDPVYVSVISVVEIVYLVEKNRIPITAWDSFRLALSDPLSGVQIVPLDDAIVQALRQIPRTIVPDMPDRIIAATALHLGLPLVTRDQQIQGANIQTIW